MNMNDTNHLRMKELCKMAGTYRSAAQLIERHTMRPLSVDSIKSWTCGRNTERARSCPDWAIRVLEMVLSADAVTEVRSQK